MRFIGSPSERRPARPRCGCWPSRSRAAPSRPPAAPAPGLGSRPPRLGRMSFRFSWSPPRNNWADSTALASAFHDSYAGDESEDSPFREPARHGIRQLQAFLGLEAFPPATLSWKNLSGPAEEQAPFPSPVRGVRETLEAGIGHALVVRARPAPAQHVAAAHHPGGAVLRFSGLLELRVEGLALLVELLLGGLGVGLERGYAALRPGHVLLGDLDGALDLAPRSPAVFALVADHVLDLRQARGVPRGGLQLRELGLVATEPLLGLVQGLLRPCKAAACGLEPERSPLYLGGDLRAVPRLPPAARLRGCLLADLGQGLAELPALLFCEKLRWVSHASRSPLRT